jgi:glycine cleavage system H protein
MKRTPLSQRSVKKINDYLWVSVEQIDKERGKIQVKVGLTEYFKKNMNPIEFIRILPEGRFIQKGHPWGSIESGRKIKLLRAPLSGIISRINEKVRREPSIINKDPYGDGWIAIFEQLIDEEELRELDLYNILPIRKGGD